MMGKLNKLFAANWLVAGLALSFSLHTLAATPAIDARQQRQHQRIHHGLHDGSLTAAEAGRLHGQQARIQRHEQRAQADGVITAGERYRLHQQQTAANANIYRQKHDAQRQRHSGGRQWPQ